MSHVTQTRCDQCRRTVEDVTNWYRLTLRKQGLGEGFVYQDYHVSVDLCCFDCVRGYIDTQAEDAVYRGLRASMKGAST
jgi:hypothetical protein